MCKSPPTPASLPVSCKTAVVQMKPKESIRCPSPVGNGPKSFRRSKISAFTSSVKKPQKVVTSKVLKDKLRVPVVSLEKIPNLAKAGGPYLKCNSAFKTDVNSSSASSSTASASSLLKPALVSKGLQPSPKKTENGIVLTSMSTGKSHQNGPKNNSKPCKRRSEREFDPNKHCGVLDPETKKPCTRSLTCKTHSLSRRRAVPGRNQHFDILLAEHKARSKVKEITKDLEHPQPTRETHQSLPALPQESSPATPVNGFQDPKVTSPAKSRPVNCVRPRSSCANTLDISSSATHPAQLPHPLVTSVREDLASRLSSEEEDPGVDEEPEKIDCLFSRHHPRPIKICSFGSRLMGRGYFVFDRRWDRFRYALTSMVEKHLNSQMWKKIPLAVESPVPSPATHIRSDFQTTFLLPLSQPNAMLPPSTLDSKVSPSNIRTSAVLSKATFTTTSATSSIMSQPADLHQVAAFLKIPDPSLKAAPTMSPLQVVPKPLSQKTSRTKRSKSLKGQELPSCAIESSCSKKERTPSVSCSPPLQTSPSTSLSGSHEGSYILNPRVTLNFHHTSSLLNHVCLNSTNPGTSTLNARFEPQVRTSLLSNPTDTLKHMGTVVSSIDSNLPPYSHRHYLMGHTQATDKPVSPLPLSIKKSYDKKRKNCNASTKTCKINKMPGMNSVQKRSYDYFITSVPDPAKTSVSRQKTSKWTERVLPLP